MNTSILGTIAGHKVMITENAVKTGNASLQIELVKRLIECKGLVNPSESALPLFYNKYLRHYPSSEMEFISSNNQRGMVKVENWNAFSNQAA